MKNAVLIPHSLPVELARSQRQEIIYGFGGLLAKQLEVEATGVLTINFYVKIHLKRTGED